MEGHDAGKMRASSGSRTLVDSRAAEPAELPKRRLNQCHQCHFPWSMHGRRYDAEERAFVRVCSEYPARPLWSIQRCIGP